MPVSDEQTLAIVSDCTVDGVYVPTVVLDDRHLLTLDRQKALRYVAVWADAIARAEFDAAVYAQLTGIGIDEHAAIMVVEDLRPDRAPLDNDGCAPLRLEPILSARTKRGQVAAFIGDENVVQLDAPAVYDHISKVLPVVFTCDLDAAYRRYAIGALNQPAWRAQAMVTDLGVRWRLPETEGAEHDRWIREQFTGLVAATLAPPDTPSPPARPRPPAGKKQRKGKGRR